MNNFNFKKFLAENKLTKASILREGVGAYEFEKGKAEGEAEEKEAMSKKALKAKIKEMIIAELTGATVTDEDYDFVAEGPDNEDYEKLGREVEYGINPETDKEELSLKDFFIDDEENIDEAKKKDEEELDLNLDQETPEGEEDLNLDLGATDVPAEDNFNIDTSAVDPNIKAVQDALTQAQAAAEKIQDEKLTQQIGNTITMFTRTHIANKEPIRENEERSENRYSEPDENGKWMLVPMSIENYLETLLPDSEEPGYSRKKYDTVRDNIADFMANELNSISEKESENLKNKTDEEIEDMVSNAFIDYMN